MAVYRMKIHKYIPQKFYGFCIDDHGTEVFFHLGSFDLGDTTAPPIVGEEVEVDVDLETSRPGNKGAPKAKKVERLHEPRLMEGIVDTFDAARGYGFIRGDDGTSYHLHKSEVLGGKFPFSEQSVRFYIGFRRGRPRACHIEIKDPTKKDFDYE